MGDAEHLKKALVGKTEDQRPVQKAHQDRQGVGQMVKLGPAFGQGVAGANRFGDFQDGAQDAVHARAGFVIDRRIEQIKDHILGDAVAVQHHRLFAERLHLALEPAFQRGAVEIPDLGPDGLDRATQGARVAIARDLGITVVIDHHMIRPPDQHLRDGRIDQRIDLDPQMPGPLLDWS